MRRWRRCMRKECATRPSLWAESGEDTTRRQSGLWSNFHDLTTTNLIPHDIRDGAT